MDNLTKINHWLPRVIGLFAIILCNLFEPTAAKFIVNNAIIPSYIAVHLIPSIVLILALACAWKFEFWGGVFYIILGIIVCPIIYRFSSLNDYSLGITISMIMFFSFPVVITGLLFIISHYMKEGIKKPS